MQYWLLVANTPQGPFDETVLGSKIESRELGPDTLVCPVGSSSWTQVADVPTLARHGIAMPPEPPPIAAAPKPPAASIPTFARQNPVNVGMLVVAIILSSCNLGLALLTADASTTSTAFDLLCFCVWAGSMTTWLLYHYAIWSYVPAEYRDTTPGEAIGFLFVPFYNFYWVFRSCVGLARSINRFADAQGYPGARMNTGLATAFCIFWIAAITFASGTIIAQADGTAESVTGMQVASFIVADVPGFILWLLMVLNQKRIVEAMVRHAASPSAPMHPVPA